MSDGTLSSKQLIADSYFVQSLLLLLALAGQQLFWSNSANATIIQPEGQLQIGSFLHFITVGGISLFGTLANYLLNEAIVHGKAGPSQALCEV